MKKGSRAMEGYFDVIAYSGDELRALMITSVDYGYLRIRL